MKYLRAMKARDRAVAEYLSARRQLDAAASGVVEACRVHPLPVLGVAAGMGFLIGRLRLGAGVLRAGAKLASGPALQLLRACLGR